MNGLAQLSPDGKWLLYVVTVRREQNQSRAFRLVRVSVDGGSPDEVLVSNSYPNVICSPARCALLDQEGNTTVVSELDPIKGKGRKLLELSEGLGPEQSLSPSGDQLAFIHDERSRSSVRIVSFSNGAKVDVVPKGRPRSLGYLDWSADGKGFFTAEAFGISFLDLHGNMHPLWTQTGEQRLPILAISSRNGKRLAILRWTHTANLWLLNF